MLWPTPKPTIGEGVLISAAATRPSGWPLSSNVLTCGRSTLVTLPLPAANAAPGIRIAAARMRLSLRMDGGFLGLEWQGRGLGSGSRSGGRKRGLARRHQPVLLEAQRQAPAPVRRDDQAHETDLLDRTGDV